MSTTMTIRLDDDLKEQLDRLAATRAAFTVLASSLCQIPVILFLIVSDPDSTRSRSCGYSTVPENHRGSGNREA